MVYSDTEEETGIRVKGHRDENVDVLNGSDRAGEEQE